MKTAQYFLHVRVDEFGEDFEVVETLKKALGERFVNSWFVDYCEE